MKKNLTKNYVLNASYQVLTLIIPLVTTPYLARILQPAAVGVLSYSESIVSYFVLFAVLGTTIYAQREIGRVQDSKTDTSRAFWEIQIIRTLSGLVSLCAYCAYVGIVKTNFVVCMILALEIVNVIVDVGWFFQGLENFGVTVVFGLCAKIMNLVCVFLLVKTPDDLWLYALTKTVCLILPNVCMWALLPKFLCKTSGIKPFRHLKVVITFFIPAIASQVYMILDKSMIGWMTTGREENGYYEYAEKLVRITIVLISSLASVMIPRVSKAYAENDFESVRSLTYKAIGFVWLISIPITLGLVAIADVFIPVYLGGGYEKSIILMRIFSPLVVFVGMANIIGLAFLIPIDKQKVYLVSVIAAAVLNLCLNLVLIPRLYSIGAAISSVIAEFLSISIQFAYIFRKRLLNAKRVFLPSIKYLICGVIMAAAVFLVKRFLPVTVWALAVEILTGVIVYFVLLLALRDETVLDCLRKVFGIFRRPKKQEDNPDGQN